MTPKVKGVLAVIALILILSWLNVPIAVQLMDMLKSLFDGARTIGSSE